MGFQYIISSRISIVRGYIVLDALEFLPQCYAVLKPACGGFHSLASERACGSARIACRVWGVEGYWWTTNMHAS